MCLDLHHKRGETDKRQIAVSYFMPLLSDILTFPDFKPSRFGPKKKDFVCLVTARIWLSVFTF